MARTKILPKPLSETGKGVRLTEPPTAGETFFGMQGRGKNVRVTFYTVVEVQPYTKRDGSKSVVITFKDEQNNFYTSGLSTAKMTPHGKKRPNITGEFNPDKAEPIGPNGMSVKLKNVPTIGDLFWTFPHNDNTKPKIYVKVTDVRPYKSPADGTQKYLVMYRDKDGNIYSSQLESYKLVNLSEPDPLEKAAEKFKDKITKAEQNA